MKTINATNDTQKGFWARLADKLSKANIRTSRWSRWVSNVVNYWKKEWWQETEGFVAKTVKLAHDVWDYLTYNAMSWTGGLICVFILF